MPDINSPEALALEKAALEQMTDYWASARKRAKAEARALTDAQLAMAIAVYTDTSPGTHCTQQHAYVMEAQRRLDAARSEARTRPDEQGEEATHDYS